MDADRLLRGGKADEIAFACAKLRQMLMREPPLIDVAMFSVSREFPLVGFCTLFEDAPVREAAFDLGDTLRRRLMEHALWQAADQGLYEIEQVLAHPPTTCSGNSSIGSLDNSLSRSPVRPRDQRSRDRRPEHCDPEPRSQHRRPIAGRCRAGQPGGRSRGVRRTARRRPLGFLDADRALKDDFSQLLALQQPLTVILDRVRPGCEFFK